MVFDPEENVEIREMAAAVPACKLAQKYGLPTFTEGDDIDTWIYELEMWKIVTDLDVKKHGPVVLLCLNEKMRHNCSSLTKEELNADDGLDKLIEKIKSLYGKNKEQEEFVAYEKWVNFKRPSEMNIRDYVNQFELLNTKLLKKKIVLPTSVLAYQVLQNANLPSDKVNLIRATVKSVKYEDMVEQIKAVYDNCCIEELNVKELDIKVDENETLYNSSFQKRGRSWTRGRSRGNNFNNRGSWRGNSNDNWRGGNSRDGVKRNALDATGNPKKCNICESIYHYANECPVKVNVQLYTIQLFTEEEMSDCYLEQMCFETQASALVDTGCRSTVCGVKWLNDYRKMVNEELIIVTDKAPKKKFKFGNGKCFSSIQTVNIPFEIAGLKGFVNTDVIDCKVPLLLSKESMKSAKSKLDFNNDTIEMFGHEIKLNQTSSGHYCIPLLDENSVMLKRSILSATKGNLSLLVDEDTAESDIKKMAHKLHNQFGHPAQSEKLKILLRDAGIVEERLMKKIDEVTDSCDSCNKYRKPRARPIVSFSLANQVNDCLAMDLKFLTIEDKKYIILHMIDVFSRYSSTVLIPSKRKEVIVDRIMKHWVSIFGTPVHILSDNGGEFNNELLRDVAELLGCSVMTTAAESPWSNGIVERHNAVIGEMVLKILDDSKCSIANALVWAVSAKNALYNNLGFSPNQLVFGCNPNTPSTMTAKPPALRDSTQGEIIAEHLNALHSARRAFIQSESSSKIKRALRHQTRQCSSNEFRTGDQVYYKRNNEKAWRGPGTISGILGKKLHISHGGIQISASQCMVRKVDDESTNERITCGEKPDQIVQENSCGEKQDQIVQEIEKEKVHFY